MNILFLSPGNAPDYQCDSLFHGLRSCYGASVIDYPRIPYLYSGYSDLSSLYGRGFTLYGLLPEIPVDRTGIEQRIRSRAFDLIVYGSIQRDQSYLDLVTSVYPRHQILFIDGEDHSTVLSLSDRGLYFKRELDHAWPGVFPIHFAIPVTKIGTIKPTYKNQVRAQIDPRDRSTYIYKDEHSYYAEYSRSLFAFTQRKAGWDAMRHLEIMANGTIPMFRDLASCPPLTCTHLPKPELIEALSYADRDATFWDTESGRNLWKSLWRRIHLKFVYYSTTQALVTQVMEVQQREVR